MIITLIICLTILIIVVAVLYYDSQSPQSKCSHDMETINTWNGDRSKQYLSTCKKCGKQEKHTFSGLNFYQ
jgi:hypothetical protein